MAIKGKTRDPLVMELLGILCVNVNILAMIFYFGFVKH